MQTHNMMSYLNNGSQSYNFLFILLLLISSTLFVETNGGYGHNYKDALTKSILFFEGQRSGKLPSNQILKWRGDSALSDGQTAGVDLSGGYYDAGDNVKFNFPMAFTTTMLSWSVIEFGSQMGSDRTSAMVAIRWGTDYLLKCASKVKSDNLLFAGVGNPNEDHKCWERPEDMDTPRTVYSVTAGSDLAAETAAALAAASIVFRNVDPSYSELLLTTAVDVMHFAMKTLAKYSDANIDACPYYCSFSGYQDELLWGAAWMYKATNSVDYLNYIKSYASNDDVDCFSWDSKFAGADVLLAGEYLVGKNEDLEKFVGKADTFMCKILRDSPFRSTIQFTPGGMIYNKNLPPDNPLQYVTTLSFLLTAYANYKANPNAPTDKITCADHTFSPNYLWGQAKSQVDYILGTNPMQMSYMVGYGPKYPERVHHRAASVDKKIQCVEGFGLYLHTLNKNPNTLIGAIVGGPHLDDSFYDVRDQGQTEPSTYINAALVGPLAYLAAT